MLNQIDFANLRASVAAIPADVSNDAVGSHAPKLEDIFAPERHSAALDPNISIVVGSRGAGKSFWSGVLGQAETREAAALAYPRLHLEKLSVAFGFTGAIGGPNGISVEVLDTMVPRGSDILRARTFWWATILTAAARSSGEKPRLSEMMSVAGDPEVREDLLASHEERMRSSASVMLIVYDALDTVSTDWPRRRLLTEALFEVIWAMRAYRLIKMKVFLRPDQIDDDSLRFVELPKLRTGAVRLVWDGDDLYGLLFARMSLSDIGRDAFAKLLKHLRISSASREEVLRRTWPLAYDTRQQAKAMATLAGEFMAQGPNGYKKGKTYDWPLKHLGDAFEEVTPRSFLGLMIGAAKRGAVPVDRALTADGIRHGLREASKTRVDQLHLEFPWIKGVLAPLAGLLLPQAQEEVFRVWRAAGTVNIVVADARERGYLPPFDIQLRNTEERLFEALERIGVMFRRKDDRLDMPDLFRVAAKLLKKGGTAPL